jgi:hypothetical protein
MANLILKPSTGGVLKLQNDAGTVDALTISTGGNLTAAGNTTLSGTANNLGTVTAGSIAGGSITSATTFPNGHVLQVKSLPYGTEHSTGSTTFIAIDSSFKLAITPASTSNKVLVFIHIGGALVNATVVNAMYTLYRSGGASGDGNLAVGGSTLTSTNDSFAVFKHADAAQGATSADFNHLDSPGVATEVTYQPYFGSGDGNTIYSQVWGHTSTITLMEIKA